MTTWELIVEQYLGKHLRGTVAGFYYEIDDLITLRTDPDDDLLFFTNADAIEAYGVEVEVEGKWPRGWTGRVSYAYARTEDGDTGKRLTASPEHLVKANLIAPLVRDTLFAGVELQYTSRRKTVAGTTTSAVVLTNLTLSSPDLLLPGLFVSASVYNLFDEEYSDPASEEHVQDALERDGRLFRIKVRYAF
jgi:iron complex outermembrane receptor protein